MDEDPGWLIREEVVVLNHMAKIVCYGPLWDLLSIKNSIVRFQKECSFL